MRATSMRMPPRLVSGKRHVEKKLVLVGMQGQFAAESWPEAEQRAADELRALGFSIVRVDSRAQHLEARMAELGAQAATERALGSVRIVRDGGQRIAQIWLHDALTGKMLLRTIKIGAAGSADAGMRVVELIYASLLETQLRPQSVTPPAIRQLVRERLTRVRAKRPKRPTTRSRLKLAPWGFSVTPALQLQPGETSPAFGLALGLQRALGPRFSIGLSLFAPWYGAVVKELSGAADLQLFSAKVDARFTLWPTKRVAPSLALGLGGLLLRSSGRALPPYISEVEWAAAFATHVTLGVDLRLSQTLWLRLSGSTTLAFPEIGVQLADKRVAVLGRPLLELGLGLFWRL